MGLVVEINTDDEFQGVISGGNNRLIVVDFTASWCVPCKNMKQCFQDYAAKYAKATFLQVDVEKCQDVASREGVTSMPTFIFYKNQIRVGLVRGADPVRLESKIKELIGGDEDDIGAEGHMDLTPFISKGESECLNENDEHCLEHCLQTNNEFLQSDCDEQLIISIAFNQAVKIHSLRIKAPKDNGPKHVRIFINHPRTLDFEMANTYASIQDLELSPNMFDGSLINLRFVKFQNVQNIQFFIKNNQSDDDVTQIDQLIIIGSPINTTNMSDFKRVAGKKGESH